MAVIETHRRVGTKSNLQGSAAGVWQKRGPTNPNVAREKSSSRVLVHRRKCFVAHERDLKELLARASEPNGVRRVTDFFCTRTREEHFALSGVRRIVVGASVVCEELRWAFQQRRQRVER